MILALVFLLVLAAAGIAFLVGVWAAPLLVQPPTYIESLDALGRVTSSGGVASAARGCPASAHRRPSSA